MVGFVLVEVEEVVVAAGAEAFRVESHLSFASFTGLDLRFPLELLVTSVAEAFRVMLLVFATVHTLFYHHRLFLFRKKKFPRSRKT